MQVLFFIKYLIIGVLTFIILDSLWLGLFMKNYYFQHLKNVAPIKINLALGFFVYLIAVIGFLLLIGPQATWQQALLKGAIYGFSIYAVYDLTNLAFFSGTWPVILSIIDICWGTFVLSMVSLMISIW